MKRTIKPPVKREIDTDAITHEGHTRTLKEWSQITGIPAFTIYSRLALGWSEAEAITKPKKIAHALATPDKVERAVATEPKLIAFQGENLPIAEWSKRTGLDYGVIDTRLRNGWTPERALTEPVNCTAKMQKITHDGETLTIPQWAERTGFRENMIRGRLRANWTPEQALTTPAQVRTQTAQAQPGVVSDLHPAEGTGGGRFLQETPEISFSPTEQVKP